ncbi:NADPH-dependent FMN reductase [Actinocorallia aurea]
MRPHLLLVSGSTRNLSTNTAALRTAALVASVDAVLYDGLPHLPPFTPDDDPAGPHVAVRHLRERLAVADAVVFSTPEYAGALPGALKNLIDWTVGGGDLYRKPVAWINVAAPGRGEGAYTQLAGVLRYVDAVIVEQCCVRLPVPRDAVGPDGAIADPALRTALAEALASLARRIPATA